MANDINVVMLVGRLTRDAELKYTNTGTAVCNFSLAVNRRKRSGDQWTDEVNYFDIVLWGKQGEAIHQYLGKGKQVAVSGELRQDRWEQDGQNRSKVKITASNVQLLGGSTGMSSGTGKVQGGSVPFDNFSQQTSSGPQDFEDDIPF